MNGTKANANETKIPTEMSNNIIRSINMRKLVILSATLLTLPAIALATPAPKVFVCKYVGTPGTNETLQTGQNPISVSSNAIKDYKGPGSYFNDAQGRSYVLVEDTGQPEPNVSECPTPINPTPPPTVQSPPVVTTPPATTTSPTPAPATPSVTTETVDYSNFVGK